MYVIQCKSKKSNQWNLYADAEWNNFDTLKEIKKEVKRLIKDFGKTMDYRIAIKSVYYTPITHYKY